jgi:tRNA uridine 5-carbamoylmethylation protein Kti12
MEGNYTNFNSDFNFILLCGLPGVGKTYFSHLLKRMLEKNIYSNINLVFLFNFDDFLFNPEKKINLYKNNLQDTELKSHFFKFEKFDFTTYSKKRKEFFNFIKEKLENQIVPDYTSGKIFMAKTFFIIDDNFYLKSMRKPFFKLTNLLSQEYKLKSTYLEIHLKANLDYCMANNLKREGLFRIPEEVFSKITKNFEWESLYDDYKLTIEIIDETTLNDFRLKENIFIEQLSKSLNENFESMGKLFLIKSNDDSNKKIQRTKNKELFIELLENKLRKSIGEYIKLNKINNKNTCKKFAIIKKSFMELIKSYSHISREIVICQNDIKHSSSKLSLSYISSNFF